MKSPPIQLQLFPPHHARLTFFTILPYLVLYSTVYGNSYDTCGRSLKCGHLETLEFPFWGVDRPSQCGLPSFEIVCESGVFPIIHVRLQKFIVLELHRAGDLKIRLARADLWNTTCLTQPTNVSFDGSVFRLSSNPRTVKIFYGCSPENVPFSIQDSFTCNSSYQGLINFFMEEAATMAYLSRCAARVDTPVLLENMYMVNMSLQETIRLGFDVELMTAPWQLECARCLDSGGRCGTNPPCSCPVDSSSVSVCRYEGVVESKRNWMLKAGIASCAAVFGMVTMCLVFYLHHRRDKKSMPPHWPFSRKTVAGRRWSDCEKGGVHPTAGHYIFSYAELEEATADFSPSRELGDGGFGAVYKGILRDGRQVAVKRLYDNNYKRVEQFMNEVDILTRLRHPNLVFLYGCTSRHCRELLLVYEYVPNGTLADHLHGLLPGPLPWPLRLTVASQTASALSYLHSSGIVHRDVKTANILLGHDLSVKVADFGLSRLFPADVTHVSTAPQGTPGYVDPEYHQCYQLTDRSDVYSFGVVLVELISSKPAVDITRKREEINLSTMAVNKIREGAVHELVDPTLGYADDRVREEVVSVAELAFRCLQAEKEMRPSMEEVVECLAGMRDRVRPTDGNQGYARWKEGDALLRRSTGLPQSPDSVTLSWNSRMTTPNSSAS